MEYPAKGEHALVVGQNGSGKSYLLQELIRQADIAPIFIIDTKGDNGFLTVNRPDETLTVFDGGIMKFERFIKQPARKIPEYVVIRPPDSEVTVPEVLDYYIQLIRDHFKKPCVIVVDELYMLHRNGRCGPGLAGALTRGRSRDQRLYGASQRPGWISRFCLSEVNHYYVFRLVDIEDRKRLTFIGLDKARPLEQFRFYEYHAKAGMGAEHDPLPYRPDLDSINIVDKGRWI
jgi:hypothetical protein